MRTNMKEIRLSRGMTQRQAALAMGTSQQHYRRLELGLVPVLDKWYEAAAKAFGCKVSDLLLTETKTDTMLVGTVGANQEITYLDPRNRETVVSPIAVGALSAVRVRDNAMAPRHFEGDLLYFGPQSELRSAHYRECVVRLRDDRTFVRFVQPGTQAGLCTLVAISPATPVMLDVEPAWVSPIQWLHPR